MMDIESLQTQNFTNIYLCQALESSSYTFTALNSNRGSEPFKFKLNLDLSKLIKSKFEKNSLLNTKAVLEEKLKEPTLSQKFKIEPSGKLSWVKGIDGGVCISKVKITNLTDTAQTVYRFSFILADKIDAQKQFNQAWFQDQKEPENSLELKVGESKELGLQFECDRKIKKYTLSLTNIPPSLVEALSVDVSF